jgi:hypothetical protein
VLNPASAPFDRAALNVTAPGSERIAFAGATPSEDVPLTSSLSFASEATGQTQPTPELLKTVAPVAVTSASASLMPTGSMYPPVATYTGGAVARSGIMGAGVAVVVGGVMAAGL